MRKTADLIMALCAAALLSSCSALSVNAKRDGELVFSGTVETRDVRVGSKSGGRVLAVEVREGEEVEAGRVLVKLDVAELEAQRRQAEARVEQQRARLERLEHGARPQEIAQARAEAEAARANLEAVRNWPRPEEVAQARAAVAAAEADLNSARSAFGRAERLRATGDISAQEFDAARFRLANLRARQEAEQKRLDLLLNGSRAEDVRAAEARYRRAQEAERLVRAGARREEVADARAQLREAEARLDQITVQLAEGEVRAPGKAVVESLPVRPGDLLTPNQPVARLLESGQLWVRIYVPETQVGLLRVGQRARVRPDSPARDFDGVVEQINSQAEFTPRNVQSRDERSHQVFGVKVRVENAGGALKSGMAADVTLEVR
jgi:HlyD family secretion protein